MTSPTIRLTEEDSGICTWYTACVEQDTVGTLATHFSKEVAVGGALVNAQRHGYELPEGFRSDLNTYSIGSAALAGELPGVSIEEREEEAEKT